MITANDIVDISYIGTNSENQRVYEIYANKDNAYYSHLVLTVQAIIYWTDEHSLSQDAKDYILEYIINNQL